ncbi:junctional sarcoplasmic reticulum protein 1 [Vombatus ursinus]|uniref:junctional sarcoplasmic reticulum protein 1 n=1 Tax=Vombatus ursinus TaxID=29139 RepID=UPI000FFDA0ED|nr:junctional sarcoplasmic reticulum protein 1 [Vombatus ursinus]XP_027708986.1 junctional sarcoplasmic reticulum protein 1 [Vombatus ursinus]XP_027708987.1 junctional sarcoplasmic reticulum protein 1 [Vombatus ursinus]XP_027708988.1 junctional sarcoplasmic reticulum protein 1 [Vombatus ursinus]XP_027708989.1 junctional sarcoplasmic reticulum protein 1 [Vombatus ursinus]XP_027708990.1 junctional sarcoplasmic reticulum protein 1 [Vombatus ursinus]XP_027708991.1 junctional sarcoplasmic reticulu
MATGDLEVLDRGLGCPEAMEELTKSVERSREESQEEEEAEGSEKAESKEETSSQVQVQVQVQGPAEEEQALDGIGDGARKPSKVKAEKEHLADKGGSGKERGKTAAAPKSAPARKKTKGQSQPQVKPQPRALGPTFDELPWGEITLNKCLALASVVAVLSMAFQVFQDVIDGEEEGPEAAPALWAWPGSSAPRDSRPKLPKPRDWAKASAPAAPPGPKPQTAVVKEASPKEPDTEGQEAEGKVSPGPAPEAAVLPEDPRPSSKVAKPEKPPWAALPKKEEKAKDRKGFREDRAEPPWREKKEGGHRPRPRQEGKEEAPRRPWEREQEHRRPGRQEDSKRARDGPRSKRQEQRGRGGREGREDRDRFFPKQKHREGKRRD